MLLGESQRQDPEWVLELNGDTSHLTEIEEAIRFN